MAEDTAEDTGLVPKRRVYDTPLGPREMKSPDDLTIRTRRAVTQMTDRAQELADSTAAADVEELENLVMDLVRELFVTPFVDDELLDIPYPQLQGYVEDFFGAQNADGEEKLAAAKADLNRAQRRVKRKTGRSSPPSKHTTEPATP